MKTPDNVEAPWVIRDAGYYCLFYSSGQYCDAIRVARSHSPFGPFEMRPQPLVATGATWAAPGHVSVTRLRRRRRAELRRQTHGPTPRAASIVSRS